jgi:hypothetical protein
LATASRRAAGRSKRASPATRAARAEDLSSLAALNEPVYVTIDGKWRRITKREAIVTQMVNESAKANLRATKMLFDMMKEVEQKAGDAPPEPALSINYPLFVHELYLMCGPRLDVISPTLWSRRTQIANAPATAVCRIVRCGLYPGDFLLLRRGK